MQVHDLHLLKNMLNTANIQHISEMQACRDKYILLYLKSAANITNLNRIRFIFARNFSYIAIFLRSSDFPSRVYWVIG